MPSPLCRLLGLLLILVATTGTIRAQGYSIVVHCPDHLSGSIQCAFWGTDSVPQLTSSRISKGSALVQGILPAPQLLLISHPKLPHPVPVFVENANIDIVLDPDNPTSSRVTGSRTNSLYRYALEQCPDASDHCLPQLVADNADQVFTPYILLEHAAQIPGPLLQQLTSQISGPAKSTIHFRQLAERLSAIQATTEGMPMPDFQFTTDSLTLATYYALRDTTKASLILFSATFSQRGQAIAAQLATQYPQLQLLVVNIDKDPLLWDAPCLKHLAIDRIPYMILLDSDGLIHTRDARIWELDRLLKQ